MGPGEPRCEAAGVLAGVAAGTASIGIARPAVERRLRDPASDMRQDARNHHGVGYMDCLRMADEAPCAAQTGGRNRIVKHGQQHVRPAHETVNRRSGRSLWRGTGAKELSHRSTGAKATCRRTRPAQTTRYVRRASAAQPCIPTGTAANTTDLFRPARGKSPYPAPETTQAPSLSSTTRKRALPAAR
jgi:hypothetical protein